MCTNQLNLAWKAKVKSSGMKLVLVSLADQANSDGVCWPGINFIADRTGLNRTTVLRNIKRLQEYGYLDIQKRVGGIAGGAKSNVYTLHIAKVANCDNRKNDSESRTTPPEPSLEPSLVYISARGIESEFKEYKSMRKQIKKPMNKTATKLLITALTKHEEAGHKPADLLEMATAKCWLSVYPPKEQNNGHERRNGQSKATVQTPLDRCNEAIKRMDAETMAEDDGLIW